MPAPVAFASAFLLLAPPLGAQAGSGDAARSADEDGAPTPPPEGDDAPGEIVVVTGTRTETPLSQAVVTTYVITREEIEASGASDASEVLEAAPGVQVDRTFRGAGIRLQGLDPKYTLVLVDGQRVIGRKDGVIDLSRFPAERIDRIEIVKGAASALYGSDAIAGVVNIITRGARDPWHLQSLASYGSRNTLDASTDVDLAGDAWTAGLDLGLHATDGYDLDLSNPQTDGSRVRAASGGFDAARKVGSSLRLLTDGAYAIRDSRRVDSETATFDVRNLTEDAGLRLGLDALAGARTRIQGGLHGTAYRDQMSEDQRGSDDLDDYEESLEVQIRADAMATVVLGDHVVPVGGEAALEHMESPRLVGGTVAPGVDGSAARLRGAVYAQEQWTIGAERPLRVVPGARLDVDSWFGAHTTPRLALRWDPSGRVALRLSGGLGYRAPAFKEMFLLWENPSANYRVEGNPDLEPETSRNVSAGFEVSPASTAILRVDAFRNDLTDMITYTHVSDADATQAALYRYENVAAAVTQGVEAAVRVRPLEIVTIDLSCTYLWTRNEDPEVIWEGDYLPLDGRAPYQGTAAITVKVPRLGARATVRGEFTGITSFYDPDDSDGAITLITVDPYANLHVRLEQPLARRRLRAFAGVDNILGEGDATWVHLDPRTYYGGLVVDLPRAARE